MKSFDLERKVAREIAKKLEISPTTVLTGAIVIGRTASVAWNVGECVSREDTLERINSLTYDGHGENLKRGLEFARDNLLSPGNGARKNIRKRLFVFVDNLVQRDPDLVNAVKELERAGHFVTLIGIGSSVSKDALKSIVSSDSKAILIPDYKEPSKVLVAALADQTKPGLICSLVHLLALTKSGGWINLI